MPSSALPGEPGSGCAGFEVVLVVDLNDRARMFPLLTEDLPLCLLPVGTASN